MGVLHETQSSSPEPLPTTPYILDSGPVLGETRPRSEASRTGVTSQVPRAPARAGVYETKDGGLVITQHVRSQACGRPKGKASRHVEASPSTVASKPLVPPPDLHNRACARWNDYA